ncbi:copper resistance protein NlpE [Tenacibaculum piscium]|uniref:Lipoprotein n=1 Tax=Tenacibaculum piscium TaxID=1458515 RepID=A0A2H1YGG9_9FLAO|nr:copper resistance protein NlpE [Tenacibaculum piscium]MBE7630360.1 hypothetical protein [Tenacibaculum piscium]MBE7670781.1 hypothetical protein [Tenacibaculum piscium]SOS74579.1 hypothetical protein TNO020_260004 [Tenacibaculum piscium]
MNKLLYILVTVLLFNACQSNKNKKTVIDEHSAEYALDYQGVYKGTLPCADCSGIKATLTLGHDKTFIYETININKKDGCSVHKGSYSVNENVLTIKENRKPKHFLVGESSLIFLDENLKPNTGKLAKHYQLKKQRKFIYQGKYKTYYELEDDYKQTLSLLQKGKNYEVNFSASKVKDRAGCQFSGIGKIKKDTLWVNIANKKDKEILMYIAPSHDNLGVEVFTPNFEERFSMMSYCGGGASLAGKYFKNTITSNNIGVFNSQTSINEVLHTVPFAQVHKKVGSGEYIGDIYDDYEIFTQNHKLLYTLTPKDTAKTEQKINRILVNSPFFKTNKGINVKSTYGDIKKAYTVNEIVPTREHIVLTVDEINASFSISKNKLQKGWWNDKSKMVNENKIPLSTQVDGFFLWWKY